MRNGGKKFYVAWRQDFAISIAMASCMATASPAICYGTVNMSISSTMTGHSSLTVACYSVEFVGILCSSVSV